MQSTIKYLNDRYAPIRDEAVPFPVESVFVWYFLLAIQKEAGITGDILEMGVEHGGTALLEAVSLADDENLVLIDFRRSERFAVAKAKLDQSIQDRITFLECSTRSPELSEVESRKFRFVHIDAGHSKEDVVLDFERFAECVSEDGLLCMDDVFEIRWPGVTEALHEVVPKSDFVPVFFANRKLYLARKKAAGMYQKAILENVAELDMFGTVRHWQEEMLGGTPVIVKLNPKVSRIANF